MLSARRFLWEKIAQMAADLLLVLAAFVAAYFVRVGFVFSSVFPFEPFFWRAAAIAPFFVAAFALGGLYSLAENSTGQKLRITAFASLAGSTAFVLLFFFRGEQLFSRALVLMIFVLASALPFAFHAAFDACLRAARRRGEGGALPTLMIGNGRAALRAVAALKTSGSVFCPVAALSPHGGGEKDLHGVPVLGKLNALEDTCDQHRIGAIALCAAPEHRLNLSLFARSRGLEFLVSPEILSTAGVQDAPYLAGGAVFLRARPSPLFGWGQLAKRAFDACLGAIGAALCLPLLFLFGTKTTPTARNVGDQTFQRLGFLRGPKAWRRLPECIHIVRGEMSLVGPAPRSPHLPEPPGLALRPGLISPPGEEAAGYAQHWNFWADVRAVLLAPFR